MAGREFGGMKPLALSLLAVLGILAVMFLTVWLAEHFTAIALPLTLIALPFIIVYDIKTEKEWRN